MYREGSTRRIEVRDGHHGVLRGGDGGGLREANAVALRTPEREDMGQGFGQGLGQGWARKFYVHAGGLFLVYPLVAQNDTVSDIR